MSERIAIVAMSAIYPSGVGVDALWQTVVGKERCFRDIPPGRLPAEEYMVANMAEDAISVRSAGLIEGWDFDLQRFRIPRDLFAAADTTHWLALDACDRLLADMASVSMNPDRVGVVIGNSLTGEVSRAQAMRLRWPYVRRVVESVSAETGQPVSNEWLELLEREFKQPLAVPGTDSLAGGLSNTIAGRLTNYFDFHGLGYTVDAACASSLLSVVHAQSLLRDGSLDVAIAGGVDMSIDPFELVGFSRLGALAGDEMRIYDQSPTGFWPGEGCGLVAMMRLADARKAEAPVLALLSGCGMSSDGSGGLTRPAEAGHRLAAVRAYQQAEVDPDDVMLFEGHGTGTAVGDPAEIHVFNQIRSQDAPPAVLGSIKANIGHTKAAAGAAGLIKAVCALSRGVLPPTTGVVRAHSALAAAPNLRTASEPEPWTDSRRIAAISALGFGGINTHVVIESETSVDTAAGMPAQWSPRDFGLLVVTGDGVDDVQDALDQIDRSTWLMSDVECVMAAREATAEADPAAQVRVAVEVYGRASLRRGLDIAQKRLAPLGGAARYFHCEDGVSVGVGAAGNPAVLFPGQGAPFQRATPKAAELVDASSPWRQAAERALASVHDRAGAGTDVAQPAIVAAELIGVAYLEALGVRPHVALGHSLGELVALAWSGMAEAHEVVELAYARGRAMQESGRAGTGMVALDTDPESALKLAQEASAGESTCELAAYNGPGQTVIGGPAEELDQVSELARRRRVGAHRLSVSHAFHTQAMSPALPAFRRAVEEVRWLPARSGRVVCSTVSGQHLRTPDPVAELLCKQLTQPVRLTQALDAVSAEADLLVEVGPGTTLTSVARRSANRPAITMDVLDGVTGIGRATAALIALGVVEDLGPWLAAAPPSPVRFGFTPRLLSNPLGRPDVEALAAGVQAQGQTQDGPPPAEPDSGPPATQGRQESERQAPLERRPGGDDVAAPLNADEAADAATGEVASEADAALTREKAAETVLAALESLTGLSLENLDEQARLSADLHLNSLQINHLLSEVVAKLDRQMPSEPTGLSDATIAETLDVLVALPQGQSTDAGGLMAAPWVHTFCDRWTPMEQLPPPQTIGAWAVSIGQELHGEPGATQLHVVLPEAASTADVLRLRDLVAQGWDRVVVDHAGSGVAAARVLFHEVAAPEHGWAFVHRAEGSARTRREVIDRLPVRELIDVRSDDEGHFRYRTTQRARAQTRPFAFTDADPLVLVTGGLLGITAECAAELARHTGAPLLFVGRTSPDDASVQQALQQLREQEVLADYRRLDLTDAAAIPDVLADVAPRVRGVLYGAANNNPQRSDEITDDDLTAAVEVKAHGFDRLIAALPGDQLELVVTFGSIIERVGLDGQLAYAHANEALRISTERYATRSQGHVIHLQWSMWSDVGMGVNLGVVDGLRRSGVTPVAPEVGRQLFWQQLEHDFGVTRLVMGRYPNQPTLEFGVPPEAPALRYVEEVVAHTPQTEFTAAAELSCPTDKALHDHRLGDVAVMPAVCALEAAAQAATNLDPEVSWTEFSDLQILKAVSLTSSSERAQLVVTVADTGSPDGLRVKLADDHGEVALLRVGPGPASQPTWRPGSFGGTESQLYGPLYFHQGAFRRVTELSRVTASHLQAELDTDAATWFSAFLSQRLVLGDVGVLDATVHALQACFPQQQLLPVAADRVVVHNRVPQGPCVLTALEQPPRDEDVCFDVVLSDVHREPVLTWKGLRLRASHSLSGVHTLDLVAPAVARHVRAQPWRTQQFDAVVTPASVPATDVLTELAGPPAGHDPRGRLWQQDGFASTSKSQEHRLTVSSSQRVGVDWEIDSEITPQLSGEFQSVVAAIADRLPDHTSALVVWTAIEAVKKTQLSHQGLSVTALGLVDGLGTGITLTGSNVQVRVLVLSVAGRQVVVAVAVQYD